MARLLLFICLVSLFAGGCQNRPVPAATEADLLTLPTSDYPADAPLGDPIDIVVTREGRAVQLNNRTAVPYEGIQLWLNRQYAADIDRIDIGDDNTVALSRLRNHFDEPFPVGGLLTPERSFPIVLAELYDPVTNMRHQLLARDRSPQLRGIGEE